MTIDIGGLNKSELIALKKRVERAIEAFEAQNLARAARGAARGAGVRRQPRGFDEGVPPRDEIENGYDIKTKAARQGGTQVPQPRQGVADLDRPRPTAGLGGGGAGGRREPLGPRNRLAIRRLPL